MGLAATPEELSLALSLESERWPLLLPLTTLGAGYPETCHNIFDLEVKSDTKVSLSKVTHIRLNMGPDGGIARSGVSKLIICNIIFHFFILCSIYFEWQE